MLDLFHQVALAVDAPIHGSVDKAVACGRNVSFRSARADQCEQSICIISAVGDDVAAPEPVEQIWRRFQIVDLSGRQHPFIDGSIRAQSATRTADGVIFAPFFPQTACSWARIIELPISAIKPGDFAARSSKTLIQTPARAQRLKRL
jgi:hypothetical protein